MPRFQNVEPLAPQNKKKEVGNKLGVQATKATNSLGHNMVQPMIMVLSCSGVTVSVIVWKSIEINLASDGKQHG